MGLTARDFPEKAKGCRTTPRILSCAYRPEPSSPSPVSLLGWVTDGGAGQRIRSIGNSISECRGRWQERGDFYPVQFGAMESTSIPGLELLVGVEAKLAVDIGDSFHPTETEDGCFRRIGDLDVRCVLWGIHGNLGYWGRPGAFRGLPLPPGRPAITPLGVRKGIYLSSACSWASSSSSDPKRVSHVRRPAWKAVPLPPMR